MSARRSDVLELLLPEADGPAQAHARAVTTFLRLLVHDASPRRATSVGLGLAGARAELERSTRERLLGALRDLLTHTLDAARDAECFLDVGTPALGHAAAWKVLEEERGVHAWLTSLPAPGELPLETAGRLLACAERLGLPAAEAALWRARWSRLDQGPRAGERAFLELLAEVAGPEGEALGGEALAGAVECLLDRGAVREAGALLSEREPLTRGHARSEGLIAWTRLLLGGGESERASSRERLPRLPAPLVELREDRPAWLAALAGRPARGRKARATRRPAAATRTDLGAVLLGVFALEQGGGVHPLHVECAPGLRTRLADWIDAREGACRREGELEHELVVRAAPVVAHGDARAAPRGAIDPRSVRSLALAPVMGLDAELCGWLRLEFEHHLLPSRARLRALARSWRERLLAQRVARSRCAPAEPGAERFEEVGPVDPRGRVLTDLVERAGLKLARRRWWAFASTASGPLLVASGGGELQDWREHRGGARALRRALLSGGAVGFEAPSPADAIDARAASGLVQPLSHAGRVVGLLVLESARRRDFEGSRASLARAAREAAASLRVAAFRAWHLERFGHDVHFDVQVPSTSALVEELLAAASTRAPVALCGRAGTGKQVLARWLHHERAEAAGELIVHACGSREAAAEEVDLFGDDGRRGQGRWGGARGGTLVLDDLERLPLGAQARLERLLDEAHLAPGPGLVVTSFHRLRESVEAGRVREGLGRALERIELAVPALIERREEIPELVALLCARFAHELGCETPGLSDEALALLWRQPWPGNLRELENFVYRLVLASRGRGLEVADVERVAQRFGVQLLRRVPSREPDAATIRAALRTTRTARGSRNKTRAALYLGWDPDTLSRRLAEFGGDGGARVAGTRASDG